jgi:hypothetical protein
VGQVVGFSLLELLLDDKNKIVAFFLILCDEKGTLGVEYNHWIIETNTFVFCHTVLAL